MRNVNFTVLFGIHASVGQLSCAERSIWENKERQLGICEGSLGKNQ